MSREPNQKVSLEDLLRLKREERPAPEFWSRFDRELRAKQLAALVEKRPWWHRLPAWSLNWRRYHLPLGATAALAFTLVSLRDGSAERAPATASVERPAAGAVTASARPVELVVPSVSSPAVGEESAAAVALAAHSPALFTPPAGEMTVNDAVADPAESPAPVSLERVEASGARFVGSKVMAALDAEPVLGRTLGTIREVKTPAVRGASFEPLAQMSSPTEVRRARFRTAMAMPVAKETVAQANDRLARNLSDERMNDTLRRFDAKADRLSLKF